jgi:hypothetical protein
VTVSPLIGTFTGRFTGDGAIIYKQCPHSRVRRRLHRGELDERRLALLERLAAEVSTVQFKQIERT